MSEKDQLIHGIDVSHHQRTDKLDWDVLSSNQGFVYLKATEGIRYVDPSVYEKSDAAIEAGIPFGFYHFCRPSKVHGSVTVDARQEVRDFIRILNKIPEATLPPVCDLEKAGDLTPDELAEWVAEFMKELEASAGVTPILYVGYYFVKENLPEGHTLGRYPLWLPQYNHKDAPTKIPHGWVDWLIWQYSDKDSVKGYKKNIDTNWARPELLQC